MPRRADHPRASLAQALELASAVDALGGECTLDSAAARLDARPGGAFGARVSTAVKFGWIAVRRGRLRLTPAYRDLVRADDAARRTLLRQALGRVPLYRRLFDRFAGRELPRDGLAALLVRDYAVPAATAARAAGWIADAMASVAAPPGESAVAAPGAAPAARGARYRITVRGPELDSTIELAGAEDLELVRALLAKVERALVNAR
jgi:hypothetical protein